MSPSVFKKHMRTHLHPSTLSSHPSPHTHTACASFINEDFYRYFKHIWTGSPYISECINLILFGMLSFIFFSFGFVCLFGFFFPFDWFLNFIFFSHFPFNLCISFSLLFLFYFDFFLSFFHLWSLIRHLILDRSREKRREIVSVPSFLNSNCLAQPTGENR